MERVKKVLLFLCATCVAVISWAEVPVLTYNGATKGDWFAAGVWLDETGVAVNWQDGAIVVITNKEVTLTANAVVYGLNVNMTGRYCVYGNGKMTLGAGGIVKTGAGEFNIQCKDGLHLSDSQSWLGANDGMICLDDYLPFTADDDVVLTGGGGTLSLRMNAGGGLSLSNIFRVTTNSHVSLSSGGSLGSAVVILDGVGNRLSADTGFVFSDPRLGSELILRNGASMNVGTCSFDLPSLAADAPGTQGLLSTISGISLALLRTETELNVDDGASLQVTVPLADGPGVTAALCKTGAGSLALNAANTYSGGAAVESGALRLLNATGAGSGAVDISAGAWLDLAAAGSVMNLISGDGAVVKSGANSLTLPGVNTYAGGTVLSGGVTRVTSPASLGSGTVTFASGAALAFTVSQTVSALDIARIGGSGMVLAGAGADVVWDGGAYNVAGPFVLDAEAGGTLEVGQLTGSGYTKTGAGTLRIAGTTGYTGEIVVSAGVLEIGGTDSLAAGVTVRTTGGGIVQLDALGGQDLTRITGTRMVALANGASADINTDSLTVTLSTVMNEIWTASSLTGATELVKIGAGTLVVSNATAFTGRVRVLDGLLRGVGSMGNNTVTVSNGVFSAYGSGTFLQNTFAVAGGTLIADAGGNLGAGAISLLSGGTLAATNRGSLGSGTLAMSTGKLRMDVGGSAGTRAITLSSSGLIEVYDGTGFDSASIVLGGGKLDLRATTTMNCDLTLTANTTCSANTSTGAATPTVATLAGVFNAPAGEKLVVSGNGKLQIAGGGILSGGGEFFVQSGGDLTILSNKLTVTGYAGLENDGKRLAVADGGTLEMTGSGKRLHAGHGNGMALFEVMTGGVFVAKSGVDVVLGLSGGSCVFRLTGGEAVVENGGSFIMGKTSTASMGTVELIAGTLKTSRQMKVGTGTGAFVFNGGTLQSDGVNSYIPWISSSIPVTVNVNGGGIDTQGQDMKVGSAGIDGAGILTQTGGGLLRFSQSSTNWTGGLTLVSGTAVASTNNALGTGTVDLGTNALRVSASALLSNTVLTPAAGGVLTVDAGVTGAVATVSGGKLIKQGVGVLLADYVTDDTDLAIQGGQVTVTLVDGIVHSPAGVPAIWVDATEAASFVTAVSNDVSRWYDRRTPGDDSGFFATNLYNRPLIKSDALNGLPVLDFGKLGQTGQVNDNRLMAFKQYQTNIRSVFWVIGSRNGGGFLLGDSQVDGSARHFHRGSASGTFGGVATDALWGGTGHEKGIVSAGETWTNGVPVNGTATGLSGDYDLVTWRLSPTNDAANNTPGAVWFATCYAASNGRLNGGQELGEVLIYTNRLSDVERKATETYLNRKWFPLRAGAGLTFGTVSLDGTGAGFINAYPSSVRMAELVVNAANAFVTGAPGATSVDLVTVTASGVLSVAVTDALAIGDLTFADQATLAVALDAEGGTSVIAVSGDLTLPATARFVVTGTAKPQTKILLIAAAGIIDMPSGQTVWTKVGTFSSASQVLVNAETNEVWLNTPQGTLLMLR